MQNLSLYYIQFLYFSFVFIHYIFITELTVFVQCFLKNTQLKD